MDSSIDNRRKMFDAIVIRVHIETNYRHGKLAYALRYFNGSEEKVFVGWIWNSQRPRAQMMAMNALLNPIALHEKNVKVEVVMWRDYLRDRFSMAQTKDNNRQYGESVSTTKEDQYPWQETYLLWMLYKKGMTPAREDADKTVLKKLKRYLEELAHHYPSPLRGEHETQPQITWHDISEFPDKNAGDEFDA